MLKNTLFILTGLAFGLVAGFLLITSLPKLIKQQEQPVIPVASTKQVDKKQVLGFLPYWFLDKARPDYDGFITTLDYFSLTPDEDGTILKYTNPGESEPGYYALVAGKLDPFFANAKAKNIKLSLTVFDGDQDRIMKLISDPVNHADNLMNDLTPIINQYGFSDLNLDLEGVGVASPSAQVNYKLFIQEVHKQIAVKNLNITLSMDVIPIDFIRNDHLAVPANLVEYLDKIILMAYDFHSPSSFVTGPVAPLYGAGTISELDTEVAVEAALKNYDPSKILLGLPFYGYSWETIDNFDRAAIVPTTALIESNKDAEDLLAGCSTCSAQFDDVAKESFIIYKNADSGTFQQIFYPDARSVRAKIDFANANALGGLAVWALGYESNSGSILTPLKNYLNY